MVTKQPVLFMDGNGDFQPFPIRKGLVHHPSILIGGCESGHASPENQPLDIGRFLFDSATKLDHFLVPFVELWGVYFQDAGKAVKEF